MKDLFNKNKSKPTAQSDIESQEQDKSRKGFLGKFSKKKPEGLDEGLSQTPPIQTSHATPPPFSQPSPEPEVTTNQPNYYSPPLANVAASDDSLAMAGYGTAYNVGTWYSLDGRIGRIQFLAFGVIWGLLVTFIYALLMLIAPLFGPGSMSVIVPLAAVLTLPGTIYSYIILPRRRLHDIGKSGWWVLGMFVPILNLLVLFYIYLSRGEEGANQYGLPPAPYNKVEFWLAMLLPILIVLIIVIAMLIPSNFDATSLEELTAPQTSTEPSEVTPTANPATSEPSDSAPAVAPDASDTNNNAAQAAENSDPKTAQADADANANQAAGSNTDAANKSDASAQIEAAIANTGSDAKDTEALPPISFDEFKQEAETTIYREPVKKPAK